MKDSLRNWSVVWVLRDARLVLVAGSLSTAALGLVSVTAMLRAHASGQGPVATTLLLMCISVPTILAMGLAGAVVDRFDPRLVMSGGALVQAAAGIALAVRSDLPSTYMFVVALSLAGAVAGPAWTVLLPHLAGEENTARLVSAQQALWSIAFPAGAGLGGILVDQWGAAASFGAGVLFLLGSATLARAVRARRDGSSDETPGGWHLLPLSAFRALRSHPVVYVLILALLPFIIAAEAVTPVEVFLVRDELGASASQFGLVSAATGLGVLLGSVLAGSTNQAALRRRLALLALGLTAVAQIGQGLAPHFLMFLGLGVLVGVATGIVNASAFTLILDETPSPVRGRVIALVIGLSRTANLVALTLGGILASALGPRPTYLIAGALGLLTAVIAAHFLTRAVIASTEGE